MCRTDAAENVDSNNADGEVVGRKKQARRKQTANKKEEKSRIEIAAARDARIETRDRRDARWYGKENKGQEWYNGTSRSSLGYPILFLSLLDAEM